MDMKAKSEPTLPKQATGLPGFDMLTYGGLPKGQASFLHGAAGAGKTIFCLQLIKNAVLDGEGGVMISFEESAEQIRQDAEAFDWGRELLGSDRFRFIDARQQAETDAAGEFDLLPLLEIAREYAQEVAARWIIIDGIDQLLLLESDPQAALVQMRQVNEWCNSSGLTVLLTGKTDTINGGLRFLNGVEFMLPVVIQLDIDFEGASMGRYCMIHKYRGSGHSPKRASVLIDDSGIRLPFHESLALRGDAPVAGREKASMGVESLDRYLGGGLFRGSVTLISGKPGTAKSTLAATFACAATARKERVLYITFDEEASSFIRNLQSVGLDLQSPTEEGLLRFESLNSWEAPTLQHFSRMLRALDEHDPQCMVVDSISALEYSGGIDTARESIEHLVSVARSRGVTTIITSLAERLSPEGETTMSHVSTVVDTWIVLDYNVRAGERNRSLSIVKSRGAKHSNQQRELVLSKDGVRLAEVYEYGSEVLMGTARVQQEMEERRRRELVEMEHAHRVMEIEQQVDRASSELERLKHALERETLQYERGRQGSLQDRDYIRQARSSEADGAE